MKLYLLLPILFLLLTNNAGAQISVLTQHNNNTRSGWNNHETKLTTTNVNPLQFGKAFSLVTDDQVYSQPLVVANLTIAGAKHNVVFLATVNNTVYAYDGDKGTLYWQKNYTFSGYRPPMNTDMTGACGGFYFDFSGNMGIVGTPVIDSVAQTLYFVARSTNGSGTFVEYLHAVSLVNGSEKTGSPLKIAATAPGNGDGSVNGVVSFDPQKNNQRQGLTLSNGIVYVTFSSHCDWSPFHGWMLGYDETTLAQKFVYTTTANGFDAGLWQAGGGPAVDANGNLYVVTGNGAVGYNGDITNTINRGESALKLTPSGTTLTVASYFTPSNYLALEGSDLDYGAMGNFLIPNSSYYFTGCKDGTLYLLNKDNMGGYSSGSNNVQQVIPLNSTRTLRCQPTYFKGANTEFVYVWSENDFLTAFPFDRTTNMLDISDQLTSSVLGPFGGSGAVLSVSSNGSADGTGILWASYSANGDANQSVRPGILRAFDANNITHELWNNTMVSSRDGAGNFAKFSAPTIANGHVYLPTFSNQVVVYGIILDSVAQVNCPTVDLALNKPAVSSSNENATTMPPSYAFDGNSATRWGSAFSDPQWIYVDLGQIDSICRVTLNWQNASAKNFLIQVSNDAQNWTTAATITNNVDFNNYISLSAMGRYVRMYGTARTTTFGYSLYEFQVNGTILSTCKQPTDLSASSITTTSAVLKWSTTGADSYIVKYNISTSNQVKTITTTGTSVTLTGLGCGTSYTWQVASVCGGKQGTYSSINAFSTSNCTNCGLLPTRVFTGDIGNISIPGEACYTGVTSYNVTGSGSEVYNFADQFRYVYKTFAGDGTLQAKLTSIDNADPNNKAGLMFRESSDSTSRNVFIAGTSGNGISLQTRTVTGGPTYSGNTPAVPAPYFLRLVKQGNTYTGYTSADSITWAQLFNVVDYMNTNGPISGGLAVNSHNVNKLSTAQFDQVGFYSYGGNQANLALDKPSYSATYSNVANTGNFANDGDTTTSWSSTAKPAAQWYYVDFGQPFKLNRVNINWGAKYAVSYQVQTSNDAVNWTTVQQITGNTIRHNTVILNNAARFLRINATSGVSSTGYTINELQAFGDTISSVTDDVARGKPVISSSDNGAGFEATNINDGDFTTRWASKAGAPDPQGIGVDLGALYVITNVNITWQRSLAKNFSVQASNDGVNWSTLKTFTGTSAYTNFIKVNAVCRFVRIYCTLKASDANNYSIYDLQVIGASYIPSGNPVLTINNFTVYPNPANEQVNIKFDSGSPQTVEVIIADMSGHKVKDTTIPNVVGPQNLAVGFSGLMPGKYTVTLKTASGLTSAIVIKN